MKHQGLLILAAGLPLVLAAGCGQSDTRSADECGTPPAQTSALLPTAASTPAVEALSPSARSDSAAPAEAHVPKGTAMPTDRTPPTSAPAPTAGDTSTTASPKSAPPTTDLETIRGRITSLGTNDLSVAGFDQRILLDADTTVVALVKPIPTQSLAVGRNVVIQARRDAQGQLIAQRITITPPVQHIPGPPKG